MIVFTDRELEFLQKEFDLSAENFDIELEGDLSDGSKMPDRCGIAAGIMDKLAQL